MEGNWNAKVSSGVDFVGEVANQAKVLDAVWNRWIVKWILGVDGTVLNNVGADAHSLTTGDQNRDGSLGVLVWTQWEVVQASGLIVNEALISSRVVRSCRIIELSGLTVPSSTTVESIDGDLALTGCHVQGGSDAIAGESASALTGIEVESLSTWA